VAFLIGSRSRRRQLLLALKYRLMRRRGLLYPDVFCLPYLIADNIDFVRDDERLTAGRHSLIFSELNGSEQQLADLLEVERRSSVPVIVLPGPPEILTSVLGADERGRKRALAGEIARQASAVWAYTREIRDYSADELGAKRIDLVPWPFDTAATQAMCRNGRAGTGPTRRIAFNIPIRFVGPARNDAAFRVLESVWSRLPQDVRERITFHSFAYTRLDAEKIREAAAEAAIPLTIEHRRGYRGFVRFIGGCDAVVNMTAGSILGRVTFIAGATGRAGLWSDNASLNRDLYPRATVSLADSSIAAERLDRLIRGVVDQDIDDEFRPSSAAVARVGNLAVSAARLRELAHDLQGLVTS
jgi:hypothetical protein